MTNAVVVQNIQKILLMRPVPHHSPIPYSELKPRNTGYVRVKRITEPVFMNAIDRAQAEVHLLIERSPEALTV